MSYYTSIGYLNERGLVINSFFQRITSRTNVDFQATDKLKLMSRFNVAYTHKNNINTGKVLQQAMRRPPQFALYYSDGPFIFEHSGQFNPIADAMIRKNESSIYDISLYQGAEFKITKNLIWNGNIQANYKVNRTDYMEPGYLVQTGITSGSNAAKLSRKLAAETYLNWIKTFKNHANTFIMFRATQNAWVRNISIEHFDCCVKITKGSKFIMGQDLSAINPISLITGKRRYTYYINGG